MDKKGYQKDLCIKIFFCLYTFPVMNYFCNNRKFYKSVPAISKTIYTYIKNSYQQLFSLPNYMLFKVIIFNQIFLYIKADASMHSIFKCSQETKPQNPEARYH